MKDELLYGEMTKEQVREWTRKRIIEVLTDAGYGEKTNENRS